VLLGVGALGLTGVVGTSVLFTKQTGDVRRRSAELSRAPQPLTSKKGRPLDSRAFATGSCVAFPPTVGNRHLTVYLDAGHGGIDPGAVGTTQSGSPITESQATLAVELDAMALLRGDGYRVVVSRTDDSTVVHQGSQDESGGVLSLQGAHDDVAARALCANESRARVLLGIYFDAGRSSLNAGSITAYDTDRSFAAANLALAILVQADVLAHMNTNGWAIPNDGVKTDDLLGSLNGDPSAGGLAAQAAAYGHLMLIGPAMTGFFNTPSQMPGVVVEPLYITDPFEATVAGSSRGQSAIALGIASAITQFLRPAHSSTSTTG
jgi:N-acetylmuramoyl-L-alanine amidase